MKEEDLLASFQEYVEERNYTDELGEQLTQGIDLITESFEYDNENTGDTFTSSSYSEGQESQ